MAAEIYKREEITQRKTKCRLCGEYLYKGEKRIAIEYDPYTYTTSKHTFMNYYHPECWIKKNTPPVKTQKKNNSIFPIIIIVGIVLFLISKILFFVALFGFLVIGIAYMLHDTS